MLDVDDEEDNDDDKEKDKQEDTKEEIKAKVIDELHSVYPVCEDNLDNVFGLVLLKDFKYNEGEWKGGTIYDPKNGKTYDCYMAMESGKKLKIRGYVMGMRALGRTTYWTR